MLVCDCLRYVKFASLSDIIPVPLLDLVQSSLLWLIAPVENVFRRTGSEGNQNEPQECASLILP